MESSLKPKVESYAIYSNKKQGPIHERKTRREKSRGIGEVEVR